MMRKLTPQPIQTLPSRPEILTPLRPITPPKVLSHPLRRNREIIIPVRKPTLLVVVAEAHLAVVLAQLCLVLAGLAVGDLVQILVVASIAVLFAVLVVGGLGTAADVQ